jgi:hypothetical protein
MKSSSVLILFVALAACAFLPSAQAQACNTVTTGDFAGCYALRASCKYQPITGACVSGAPSLCYEFYTDQTGCNARANCTFSTALNMCTDGGTACASIALQAACQLRSDCQWSVGTCQSNIAGNSCAARYTSGDCLVRGCVWDHFVGRCFASMAEITSQYSCSSWSDYPAPNYACSWHQCELAGSVCVNVGSGLGQSDNQSVIIESFSDAFVNPSVASNSLQFSLDVIVPFDVDLINPQYIYVLIGGMEFGEFGSFVADPTCTSARNVSLTPRALVWPQVPVTYSARDLSNAIAAHIRQFGNMDFPTNTELGQQMAQVMGNIRVGPTELIRSVSIDVTNSTLTFHVTQDLAVAAANCTRYSTKASVVNGFDEQQYYFPVSVVRFAAAGDSYQTSANFYATVTQTTLVAFSATSGYQPVVTISRGADFPTNGCGTNRKRMRIVYQLQYRYVFDTSLRVCPRNCSDVVTSYSGSGLTNAYGDACESVSAPVCSPITSMCTCFVTMTSRCRAIQYDGQAFFLASRADDADRIADMGSDIPYPTQLNGVHTFYVYPWQWKSDLTEYRLVTQSPAQFPDPVVVVYNQAVYPDAGTTLALPAFDLQVGLLPTPTSNLTEFVSLLQVINGTLQTPQVDFYNYQLRWDKFVTPVAILSNAGVRSVVDLRILNEAVNFTIQALNPAAQLIAGSWPLNWTNIDEWVSYTNKEGQAQCESACSRLPGIASVPGADGFSISVAKLRQLLPANGYRFQFRVRADLASYLSLGGGSAARRLLQANSGDEESVFLAGFKIQLIDDRLVATDNDTQSTFVPVNPDLTDLGDTTVAVASGIGQAAAGLVVAAGVGAVVGSAAAPTLAAAIASAAANGGSNFVAIALTSQAASQAAAAQAAAVAANSGASSAVAAALGESGAGAGGGPSVVVKAASNVLTSGFASPGGDQVPLLYTHRGSVDDSDPDEDEHSGRGSAFFSFWRSAGHRGKKHAR